jgi:hypothetical protein
MRTFTEVFKDLQDLEARAATLLVRIGDCGSCNPRHLVCGECAEFHEELDAIIADVRVCLNELVALTAP